MASSCAVEIPGCAAARIAWPVSQNYARLLRVTAEHDARELTLWDDGTVPGEIGAWRAVSVGPGTDWTGDALTPR